MKQKFTWYLVATTIWMIMIFLFSAQPADESSKMSGMVVEVFNVIFQGNEFWVHNASFLVRKCAHMSEYALLSILFARLYHTTKYHKYAYILAIGCSFLYACSDEIHQLFVEGRAGMIQDVMIDTLGACMGVGIIYVIHIILQKRKRTSLIN